MCWPKANFGLLLAQHKFSTADISHNFCRSATKFGSIRGLANRNLFPEFRELWSRVPVIPCGDMHRPFTDVLVKWFFDNFLMFADSFRLVSIHCVARGLGAGFPYKCPASRGSSVRQHGFLVLHLYIDADTPASRCCWHWKWARQSCTWYAVRHTASVVQRLE